MGEFMKGIIFDFNGTLFWDSQLHYDAWRMFSEKLRGYPFTDDEMRKYMFGRTNKDIITYCTGKVPSDDVVEKLAYEKESLYREQCLKDKEHFKLAPGAVEFLDWLTENDIPRTIATMSEWQNVEFYIKEFNLARWFDLDKIVYSNGKIKGKPDPEIYQIACRNLGLPPEDCIVIEDAVSGIESAHRAGIGKIIAIASLESHELYKQFDYLYQIVDRFEEIDKSLFGGK
jgi:beta-phosphoglucomutase-like phosphatase (HAD superfamily)